ncbi:hypothetical protein [Sinorhizobium sp. BG8]|uniref:hypothetical protein n=1 Tax=Sinorhizobium sp. BG8 TaxID=2613773 RepID=UPI00193E9778|nr:hypothetical protein [Sinorhizobium sp. BG8]QRM53250.1 hypothetical protein F3Y30_00690 [Sinorhizobium sp. BG8]
MVDETVPAPPMKPVYHPDSIILYGVKLNSDTDYATFSVGNVPNTGLRVQLFTGNQGQSAAEHSIVLAYGYAFEGHCYRFDTPRTFIVFSGFDYDAVGCGFDSPAALPAFLMPYRMWYVRSSDELLELSPNFGDAKALILDANLPGKRSPASYAINMSMAHRGGRLTHD